MMLLSSTRRTYSFASTGCEKPQYREASGFGVEFGLAGLAEFTTLQTRYKYKPAPGTPA